MTGWRKPGCCSHALIARHRRAHRRGLDGQWSYDYSSNPGITDDFAERSGLAKLNGKQSGPADTQGKSGWQMVRLVDVDYANPQLRDYVCREIERIIPQLRPDGIHADNLSDTNLGHANTCAFGLWSLHTFRDYLRRYFTPAELERMGIADVATFDLAAYIRDKPFETRGKRWHILNPKWTEDPVWLCYVTPEMQDGTPPVPLAAASVDHRRETLRLRTPAFDTCLIVFLRSHRLSGTTPAP